MRKGKEDERETRGPAIWKRTTKKSNTVGDKLRDWLSTGMPGGIMLAAYAPVGATETLTD